MKARFQQKICSLKACFQEKKWDKPKSTWRGVSSAASGKKMKKGITLIELLIALAILISSILAIVRIFPVGLHIMELQRLRSVAQRLAQYKIEKFKNYPKLLPIAIAATEKDTVGTGYLLIDTYSSVDGAITEPAELTPDVLNIKGSWQDASSGRQFMRWVHPSLQLIKHIIGEGVDVRAPTLVDTDGDGNKDSLLRVCPLQFGQPLNENSAVRVYYPTPYKRLKSLSELRADGNDYQEYFISGNKVYFNPVNYDRWFKVDYSYYDGSTGKVFSVVSEELYVAANSDNAALAHASPGTGEILIPASETIFRQFRSAPNPTLYDYILQPYKSLIYLLRDPGTAILRVDYPITSWEVICEEKTVPTTDSGIVKLSMNFIDSDADLVENAVLPGHQNIIIYDLETGEDVPLYDPATGKYIASKTDFEIDFAGGYVEFKDTAWGRRYWGRTLRFLYKTDDKFAIQFQKAANQYVAVPYKIIIPWENNSNPPPVSSLTYLVAPDELNKEYTYLLCSPTETNKEVLVSYWYAQPKDANPDEPDFGKPLKPADAELLKLDKEIYIGKENEAVLYYGKRLTKRWVTSILSMPVFEQVDELRIRLHIFALIGGEVVDSGIQTIDFTESSINYLYLLQDGSYQVETEPTVLPNMRSAAIETPMPSKPPVSLPTQPYIPIAEVITGYQKIEAFKFIQNYLKIYGTSIKARVLWANRGRRSYVDIDTFLRS